MRKTSLILKHFQKASLLTVKNQDYAKTVSGLFHWLTENDQVQSDQTTRFFPSKKATAKIISHEEAILAGIEEINFLLENYTQLSFKSLVKDGQKIKRGQTLAEITGSIHELLAYERTILNIFQRMSGIATETDYLIYLLKSPKLPKSLITPHLAATRKTPWGLLDKKAVAVGGGLTHRLSLADGILIKDNHLAYIKNVYGLKTAAQATAKALELASKNLEGLQQQSFEVKEFRNTPDDLIEIEVKDKASAYTAIEAFQKLKAKSYLAILFDNFSPSHLSSLLSHLSDLSSIIFEASGGITKDNILSYAQTGVDILSLGSLTHSCCASNFSLEIS